MSDPPPLPSPLMALISIHISTLYYCNFTPGPSQNYHSLSPLIIERKNTAWIHVSAWQAWQCHCMTSMISMTTSLHDKHALNSCLWCWGQHQLSRRHCKPRHNAVRETDFNLKLYLIKINLINNKVHKINKHFWMWIIRIIWKGKNQTRERGIIVD